MLQMYRVGEEHTYVIRTAYPHWRSPLASQRTTCTTMTRIKHYISKKMIIDVILALRRNDIFCNLNSNRVSHLRVFSTSAGKISLRPQTSRIITAYTRWFRFTRSIYSQTENDSATTLAYLILLHPFSIERSRYNIMDTLLRISKHEL